MAAALIRAGGAGREGDAAVQPQGGLHAQSHAILERERFSKTFQLNAAAMALTRISDELILEVNGRWTEIFGFSREEIVGRSTSEIGLWKDPAERARAMRDLETHGSFRARECQFVLGGNRDMFRRLRIFRSSRLGKRVCRRARQEVRQC